MTAAIAHWLDRRTGSWSSQRRYIFDMKTQKQSVMETSFRIEKVGALRWQVVWTGQTEGIMELTLEGDTLHRSRDYFGDGSHSSRVSLIDDDTLLLQTHYDGTIFREEIRFLKQDNYALRQTVGFDEATGRVKLVGQYYEERL